MDLVLGARLVTLGLRMLGRGLSLALDLILSDDQCLVLTLI